MKKTITVGVYNPRHIHQAILYCSDQIFTKGIKANNYKVTRTDYKVKSDLNGRLLKISETIEPDLFWFDKHEKTAPESIEQFESMFSRAIFIK